eukprot:956226-Amphidinium_carterae.1
MVHVEKLHGNLNPKQSQPEQPKQHVLPPLNTVKKAGSGCSFNDAFVSWAVVGIGTLVWWVVACGRSALRCAGFT